MLALFVIHNLQVDLENGNQVVYNKPGDEHMTTSGLVKQLCNENHISLSELARRLGQSRQNLYKNYTWTNSNNVTSAKMSTLNEAVLYMRSLPEDTRKILAIKKDIRTSNSETLASYYCRIYGHLL
ncbi:MAG: helix-turn-helix domain-containing protein [Desulfosporosinus sp.]